MTVPAANPITYMPHPAGVTAAPGGAQSVVQAPPSHQLPQQQTPQNIQFVAPPTANAPPGKYSCTYSSAHVLTVVLFQYHFIKIHLYCGDADYV